VYPVCSW